MEDIASIKPSELKAKTDFPYKIKHPYNEEEKEIKVTLELCTVYKNVPYGLAIINYKNADSSWESFKGVAIFNKGKLEMTQFLCINGNGWRNQIMNMKDGRTQQNGLAAVFISNLEERNTTSLTKKDKVHGFCCYLGALDNNFIANGYGKSLLIKGRVFIGNYYKNKM